MLKKGFIICISIFYLFYGCKISQRETVSLYPLTGISEFEENVFFSDLRTIQKDRGNIYFSSFTGSKIYVLDSDLNLTHFFGEEGRGPGEFSWISGFFVENDTIYANDGRGSRVHLYDVNGEFKHSINLPPVDLTFKRFTILNNKLYFPAPVHLDTDIIVVDLTTGEVKDEISITNEKTERFINARSILRDGDYLITVDVLNPYVERISAEGEVLEIFDLSGIHELNGLWNHYRSHKNQNHYQSYVSIFMDAYLDSSLLYILCAPWPESDDYAYVIQLEVGSNKMKFRNLFKIQGGNPSARFFQSLAVSGNRLIAIEGSTQTINKFDLSVIN